MNKYLLLALVSLMAPGMTLAGDQGKPSKAGQIRPSSRQSYTLHNIGTGDGVIGQKSSPTTKNLGDTATHEVGHYHKRIDKASPLVQSGGKSGNIMQDYYAHSNFKSPRKMADWDAWVQSMRKNRTR